jgi:hypothetical protein
VAYTCQKLKIATCQKLTEFKKNWRKGPNYELSLTLN